MPESGTSGSVGAGGGKPPSATRPVPLPDGVHDPGKGDVGDTLVVSRVEFMHIANTGDHKGRPFCGRRAKGTK